MPQMQLPLIPDGYSATGKLLPYADENDCYRHKQESMLKMIIKLKAEHNEL